MHNSTKSTPLKPLPMRVTERQYERLKAQRAKDGYTVQELVRRALDFYLDSVEAEDASPASDLSPAVKRDVKPSKAALTRGQAQVAKPAAKRVRSASPKVVYR